MESISEKQIEIFEHLPTSLVTFASSRRHCQSLEVENVHDCLSGECCSAGNRPVGRYFSSAVYFQLLIIFKSELELLQFDKVLKLSDSKEYMISVKQLGDGENYRDTLREVKNSGSNNIILDCPIDVLPEVLKQAQQVGLMVAEYSFIITNLVKFGNNFLNLVNN